MSDLLDRYCLAWNARDLEGLFALFGTDAVYVGLKKTLHGKAAIRQMYEAGFADPAIRELTASPHL